MIRGGNKAFFPHQKRFDYRLEENSDNSEEFVTSFQSHYNHLQIQQTHKRTDLSKKAAS